MAHSVWREAAGSPRRSSAVAQLLVVRRLDGMRVIALLSLVLSALSAMLLNGQVFTDSLFVIGFGVVAVICGIAAARRDYQNKTRRWQGWIMAGLGFGIALLCVVRLPSAYAKQERFNELVRKAQEMQKQTPNTALEPTGDSAGSSASRSTSSVAGGSAFVR